MEVWHKKYSNVAANYGQDKEINTGKLFFSGCRNIELHQQCVYFNTYKDYRGSEGKPEQQYHYCTEGAIKFRIIGEVADIILKSHGKNNPG